VSGNEWHSCGCGKRGWTTHKGARAHLKSLRSARTRRSDLVLNTYRCQTSPTLWHVGNTRARPNLNDPRLRFLDGAA
jgi:hypothetical protein